MTFQVQSKIDESWTDQLMKGARVIDKMIEKSATVLVAVPVAND